MYCIGLQRGCAQAKRWASIQIIFLFSYLKKRICPFSTAGRHFLQMRVIYFANTTCFWRPCWTCERFRCLIEILICPSAEKVFRNNFLECHSQGLLGGVFRTPARGGTQCVFLRVRSSQVSAAACRLGPTQTGRARLRVARHRIWCSPTRTCKTGRETVGVGFG